MLTAAVRDLHLCYPGRFITDVRTPFPELWENNPYITPLDGENWRIETVECHYPLIGQSNQTPHHVIHGFVHFLNERLSLNIQASAFKGDIHLTRVEKAWISQVGEITGSEIPYWIIVSGGKYDVTIKWWDSKRYQRVVDFYRGNIQFVQTGASGHYHPPLNGVIDLREKTNLRELIRLVYHAQGVVCPVTSLMHLAAAVETKPGMPKNRPCVVIAGGREPSQWEAYPHHQFIHTNGALFCCDNGGCWKSRTVPLGDGDDRDRSEHLCVDVLRKLPRCMSMISAAEVIRRIGTYFRGGALSYLSPRQALLAQKSVRKGDMCKWQRDTLEEMTFRKASEKFIKNIPEYPNRFTGRGVIICAGGRQYLACAWVCVKMLRKWGCSLPIEIWHLGKREIDYKILSLFEKIGVKFVDALQIRKTRPARTLAGWPLKAYAIVNCRFKDVLLLDADNVPIRNPEYLFNCVEFKKTGAVFWPDFGRLARTRSIWRVCGVRYRDESEFESGQILVNKERCWQALSLALWYNEHADFYYQHIHGDKDTFHMAFRKLNQKYSMPQIPILPLDQVMCQHDFRGKRIFQHRNLRKWNLHGHNARTVGFLFESECLRFLRQLRKQLPKRRALRRLTRRLPEKPRRRFAQQSIG